jgi:hypothetical protein
VANRSPIRPYGRHINLGAELCDLFSGHASPDIASRHPEPSLPAASIEYLLHAPYTGIDHEVLDPSDVPEQPNDRIVVIDALA